MEEFEAVINGIGPIQYVHGKPMLSLSLVIIGLNTDELSRLLYLSQQRNGQLTISVGPSTA